MNLFSMRLTGVRYWPRITIQIMGELDCENWGHTSIGMNIGQTLDQYWSLLIISHLELKIRYFLSKLCNTLGILSITYSGHHQVFLQFTLQICKFPLGLS